MNKCGKFSAIGRKLIHTRNDTMKTRTILFTIYFAFMPLDTYYILIISHFQGKCGSQEDFLLSLNYVLPVLTLTLRL